MSYYFRFPRYVSAAEKQHRSKKKLQQLRKKDSSLKPVILKGSAIADTWWGKAWNKNLEAYADYSNRIGRGRSYVRSGAVLDLRIAGGTVTALVMGSDWAPYKISIKIKPIAPAVWSKLKKACRGQLASVAKLLEGQFPNELQEVFTQQRSGLFPGPKEITFSCSCPDWASMCKHVAASLYGVGNRLDEDPSLFFTLRKVKMDDLVQEVAEEQSKTMLKTARKKTGRVIDDSAISELFGITVESVPTAKDSIEQTLPVQKKPSGNMVKKKRVKLKKKVKSAVKKRKRSR